jgi:hypothetical protein
MPEPIVLANNEAKSIVLRKPDAVDSWASFHVLKNLLELYVNIKLALN